VIPIPVGQLFRIGRHKMKSDTLSDGTKVIACKYRNHRLVPINPENYYIPVPKGLYKPSRYWAAYWHAGRGIAIPLGDVKPT